MWSLRHSTRILKPFASLIFRSYKAKNNQAFRVAVIGAGGGIGQPLSLLLRMNPQVSSLSLYDLKLTKGVAADLSHIDVAGSTVGYEGGDGDDMLKRTLACADIVVIPAGVPRKPGQTRDDLFKVNADIIAGVMEPIAKICPKAFIAVITNPINSIIPAAAEVLKKHDAYDPARLFGITALDDVRARKFVGDKQMCDPKLLTVPVIGGHSAETIVPVISKSEPEFKGDDDEIECLTKRIKNAGTEVVEAKAGAGSATLSMAYAGADFVNTLLNAKAGKEGVKDIAFVESCVTEAEFFSSEIAIGQDGITEILALPELSNYEKNLLCDALPILKEDIKKGIEHGKAFNGSKKNGDKKDCK